jgi:hypothetical protein
MLAVMYRGDGYKEHTYPEGRVVGAVLIGIAGLATLLFGRLVLGVP